MKTLIFFLGCIFLFSQTDAQQLYIKSFGNPADPAVIFLHGGPGYNAASFEATTAKSLSEKGLFVIVYDRRGEGRSMDPDAQFTFEESMADINQIYQQFHLTRASLIGHSFGGVIGVQYARAYPGKVHALILVGAPVDLQASFRHIIQRSRIQFEEKKDSARLRQIDWIEKMDTGSLMYSSSCFQLAMQNGSYSVKNRSEEAQRIQATLKNDSTLFAVSKQMTIPPVSGFWKNENYTTLDLSATLGTFRATNIRVYALYGKEDGLYAPEQIMQLKNLIGENQVFYLDDCSHNVFIDQPHFFIKQIVSWCK